MKSLTISDGPAKTNVTSTSNITGGISSVDTTINTSVVTTAISTTNVTTSTSTTSSTSSVITIGIAATITSVDEPNIESTAASQVVLPKSQKRHLQPWMKYSFTQSQLIR